MGGLVLIAGMIVKVDPERAGEVARQLGRIPNVSTYGVHKEENIVLVAEGHDEGQLENLARYIVGTFEGVRGVYPTFIGSDEAGGRTDPAPSL